MSGTQATQAVAGTTQIGAALHGIQLPRPSPRTWREISPRIPWRTAAAATPPPGSAVSVAQETVVPYAAFSHFLTGTTPVSVNHTGTSVSTSVAFNLAEGVSLGTALDAIEAKMSAIHIPVTITGGIVRDRELVQDQQRQQLCVVPGGRSQRSTWCSAMLYESYSQPITILSTLPSAGLGALLALLATGTEFSVIAFLGILLLIGIVKKNGIMMVDFALDAERELGMNPRQAITHACALRFRPIMMTTCAAIAGALPLAVAYGDGTEMRRPLGISIVGGLIVSQILTVYTTPVIFLYIHGYTKRLRGKKSEGSRRRSAPRMAPATIPCRRAPDVVHRAKPVLRRYLARRDRFGSAPYPQAARSGPTTRRPAFDTTPSFKEDSGWKPTEPSDVLSRGPWWKIFNDDVLDQLEAKDRRFERKRKTGGCGLRSSEGAGGSGRARACFRPSPAALRGSEARAASFRYRDRHHDHDGKRRHRDRHGHRYRYRQHHHDRHDDDHRQHQRSKRITTYTAGPLRQLDHRHLGTDSPHRRKRQGVRASDRPRRLPPRACPRRPRSRPTISSCAPRISCRSCWTTPWSRSSCPSKSRRAAIDSASPPRPTW